MANISDAYGDFMLKIVGKDMNETASLSALFKDYWKKTMCDGCCYYTEVYDWQSDVEDGDLVWRGQFNGCGRWTFEANCRNTFDWLKQGAEKSDELRKAWEEINKHYWVVEYDFQDEEGGCGVLYTMGCYVEHQPNEDRALYSINYEDDYEYTPENLVELGFYGDIEDAKEACGDGYE